MPGPIWVTTTRNWRLSGRVRFLPESVGCFWHTKSVIALEVEETYESATYSAPRADDNYNYEPRAKWRLARTMDLCDPALRWLIDASRGDGQVTAPKKTTSDTLS